MNNTLSAPLVFVLLPPNPFSVRAANRAHQPDGLTRTDAALIYLAEAEGREYSELVLSLQCECVTTCSRIELICSWGTFLNLKTAVGWVTSICLSLIHI